MELVRFPSRGGFSVRSIIMFVLAVIATALLWTTLTPTATHAADASWSGDSIIFDNHAYTESTDTNDTAGTIPKGATVYKTPVITDGNDKKVFVIYFTSGVDPPTAASASYVEFTYDNGKLSDAKNKKTIAISEKSDDSDESSCSVSGIGWIVCPVSVFLADAMDNIFSILASMLNTQPLVLGDSSNSMYRAWDISRSIANVAFVIAFLIIIYSQLTSFGVSNYGIKKMIPRLIVAAVLVNLSFYIMAIAIDVSNILGYSVQNLFNIVRENLFTLTNDNLGPNLTSSWAEVTSKILAAGGAVAGYMYVANSIYLLVPLLIGLVLVILLVLIILAARQAIIVVLVILAPLAFVANLLPNTEKWFTKWKDLLMTMLIFFPAFSLVFGGSQLAGQLIIQNAGDKFFMVVFGMAVQVAPLAITPLIMKFSGGMLGKIAQIANNPKKGIIDRNRNWAEKRQKLANNKNIAQGPRLRNPTSWAAGALRRTNFRGRNLDNQIANWEQEATNRYEQTAGFRKTDEHRARVGLDKESIQNTNAAHIERQKQRNGTRLHASGINAQVSKERLEEEQSRLTGYYNEQRTTRGTQLNQSMERLETQKSYTEASEQDKGAYLNRQRTYRTTMLGAAAERLEAAKMNAEGWQGEYTAHIDKLKVGSKAPALHEAAIFAQSSKEHAEAAQVRVQAMFDQQHATEGTTLNASFKSLDAAKLHADAQKSYATTYLSNTRAEVGTELHTEFIRSEQAKLASQVAEARTKHVVDEYKTGKLVRTGELSTIMNTMVDDVSILAAETRGAQAAQNIQQKNVAQDFKGNTPFTEQLLQTAASVDPAGRIRAQASASAALNKISTETRTVNESLLEDRALSNGQTPVGYAVELIKNHLSGAATAEPDVLEAAMEMVGKDGQIPLLRKMRQSNRIDQETLWAMFTRNSGTIKEKGGADLVLNPKIAGASRERMDSSIAAGIGGISPDNMPTLKFINMLDYGKHMSRIINNTENETDPEFSRWGLLGLQKAYKNLTIALRDPQIVRRLGDNLIPAIMMHKQLQDHFGDPTKEVDYNAITPIPMAKIESDIIDDPTDANYND